jgi:Fe-S-cluster containining protein
MSDAGKDHGTLCKACGLCCSGVLFHRVLLAPGEAERAAELGLSLEAGENPGFTQPCSRFAASGCTIYDQRPSTCRRYRCEVLLKLERGEIESARATEVIASALALVADAEAGEPGSAPARLRAAERGTPATLDCNPEEREKAARQSLALLALERYLDRHFRGPNQKKVMEC